MSIVDNKQKIFGKLGALKTLNDGYPNFNKSNSYQSINNDSDSSAFLVDLIITLLGQEELKNICVEFLSSKLDDIEIKIKNCLRNTLNNKLGIGTNPSIPDFMIDGFDISVKSIDFKGMFKTDPLTVEGELLYDDNTSGLNSIDFNTFLFELLQDSVTETWGTQVGSPDLFDITSNIDKLNIKVNSGYTGNTLSSLNNEYIDKLDLFDSAKLINGIIDRLFGTVSSGNKTQDELITEAKLDSILKSLIEVEDGTVIDDSYFQFSDSKLRQFEEDSLNRSNGVMVFSDCGDYNSRININTLSGLTSNLKNSVTFIDKKTTIDSGLSDLANDATENTNDVDKPSTRGSFFKNFTTSMSLGLSNSIITPKLLFIILLNSMVFDNDPSEEPIEILKSNSIIFKTITCACNDSILSELLKIATKEIMSLVTSQATNLAKERTKNQVLTTLSLVGVPQQTLSIIRGL